VFINYCELPHLLQNFACFGMDAAQTIQFFFNPFESSESCLVIIISTGLWVGTSSGNGKSYSSLVGDGVDG
jgi:hypothetical protein